MDHYNKIKIIQHNVLKWTFIRSQELSNYYLKEKADIILLNSTRVSDNEKIKLYQYNVYQINIQSEASAGVAIAIRNNIKHQLIDDFNGDMLAIRIETSKGPVLIATTYLPPRRNYIPIADMRRIFQKQMAVYLSGELNGRHRTFGYSTENETGKQIVNLLRRDVCKHLGPDFNTLINPGIKGRPDIVLGNRYANLYMTMYEGNLTTSDHVPVIMEVSTKPIMTQITPRWNLKRTDWDNFKTILSNQMIEQERKLNNTRVINKEIIDEELEYWVKAITTSVDQTTPKRAYKITPNIKETDTLRRVENQYINLRFTTNYWTRQQIEDIKTLQRIILNKTKQVNESHWNTTIENLQEIYNDSAKFWNKVRILKGQPSSETPYLVNDWNIKIHKTAEKTELYREYWQNIFQINQEDNINFD